MGLVYNIDRMREWWRDKFPVMDKMLGEEFREHLDAIERDVKGMCDFCERLDNAAFNREDVTLYGVDYTALPVDAEGVSIHIGDVVTMDLMSGGKSKPLVVDRMELSRGKDGLLWCVALDTDKECWNQPSLLHHHHEPTVEDVLREFAEKITDSQIPGIRPTYEEAIAEYAAKLRLAGDE